jgi:hypothetical protein
VSDRLVPIQERADAATKGPWDVDAGDAVIYSELGDGHGPMFIFKPHEDHVDGYGTPGEDCIADAEFITHARTDVPALLAMVRELQGRVDAAKAEGWDRGMWYASSLLNAEELAVSFQKDNPYRAAITATEGA